jgi:hypothetical protein
MSWRIILFCKKSNALRQAYPRTNERTGSVRWVGRRGEDNRGHCKTNATLWSERSNTGLPLPAAHPHTQPRDFCSPLRGTRESGEWVLRAKSSCKNPVIRNYPDDLEKRALFAPLFDFVPTEATSEYALVSCRSNTGGNERTQCWGRIERCSSRYVSKQ